MTTGAAIPFLAQPLAWERRRPWGLKPAHPEQDWEGPWREPAGARSQGPEGPCASGGECAPQLPSGAPTTGLRVKPLGTKSPANKAP